MTTQTPIPTYLFYLVDELGKSYYIDSNGLLQKQGLPAPLQFSPDGWDRLSIGFERNLKKFGLIRNFSISLGFVGDGGLILEKIKNRGTVDSKLWLLVQILDVEVTDTEYAITHKFHYKGEIDFSTYRRQERKVTVNIMEGGRSKELKANEGKSYELPLATDPDRIRVLVDGPELQGRQSYAVTNIEYNAALYLFFAFSLARLQIEGDAPGLVFFDQEFDEMLDLADYLENSLNYFCQAEDSLIGIKPLRIYGSFPLKLRTQRDQNFIRIRIIHSPAADPYGGLTYYDVYNPTTGVPLDPAFTFEGEVKQITFDRTINMSAGDRLFWYCEMSLGSGFGDASDWEILADGTFACEFVNRFQATFVWMYKPIDYYRRLIEKVCGSRDYAESSMLTQSTICVTSGDALRGLDSAVMKGVLNDFTNAWYVLKSAGLGIENGKVQLERRPFFMNDDVIIDLGEVKDMEVEPATDIMFSGLTVGYQDQNYDDVNGRLEYNTLQERSSPIQRVTTKLELVSGIRADAIGMESYRRNLTGKTTTDSENDNDTFFVNVDLANPLVDDLGTYYKLKRVAYTSVTGVPLPEFLYNIEELTPGRILKEWESFFRGVLKGYEDQFITFGSAKKNREFATTGGPGGDFDEDKEFPVGGLAEAYFQPDKLKFKCPARINLYTTLQAYPRACFRWTYLAEEYKGYLLKGSILSKTNAEQEFIMLSHKDNDLTLLENG